jgi:hypothetical protein
VFTDPSASSLHDIAKPITTQMHSNFKKRVVRYL